MLPRNDDELYKELFYNIKLRSIPTTFEYFVLIFTIIYILTRGIQVYYKYLYVVVGL